MWTPISIFGRILSIIVFISVAVNAESPDPARGKRGMVVSASDLATDVGVLILKRGGNAVDAAVAVGFALAVTYPQAGNLGGGGYMVIHLADGRDVALDYREKAPLNAHRDMYLDSLGNPDPLLSTLGHTAAGIPGSVAGLVHALEKYGTMKLEEVIQPAISIAEEGFPLSYRMAQSFNYNLSRFNKFPSSQKVFTKNGEPYKEGDIFKQPDLAKTLKLIQKNGARGFYSGETAELMIKQSQELGGYFTKEDLENYKVIEKAPLKGTYKGYDVLSMPPSSAGGIILVEALNILENFNITKEHWNSSWYNHHLIETFKYVFADRSRYIGDDQFVKVPVEKLTSKEYASEIARHIADTACASEKIFPGTYTGRESTETTHYSITDQYGNAVSTTTTINSTFGSSLVVEGAGFLLNNEMDDFSAKPGVPNQFGLTGSEANAIAPGKRMLSSMTPTIVLKGNQAVLVVGSPGGSTIPTVIIQTVMNFLVFSMDIQEAIDAPKIHHQWLPDITYYEENGLPLDVLENMKLKGHKMGDLRVLGRVEGISIGSGDYKFQGATDPRGYGKAAGF